MKKKLSIILVAVLILSLVSLPASASKDTKANIKLIGGGIEIIDPGVTPPAGYEDINTTEMDFGIRNISVNTETYPSIKAGSQAGAKPEEDAGILQPVGLILKDARGLDGLWGITVKGSAFQGTSGKTLNGYTISLVHDGTITGPAGGNAPSARGSVGTPVVIDEGALPKPIFDSNVAGSQGSWGANWNASITILAGTPTADTHTSVVTWGINLVPTP